MATTETKIGEIREENIVGSTMPLRSRFQAAVRGNSSVKRGCLLCQILLFAFLCLLVGSLTTSYYLANFPSEPSIEGGIKFAVERCFREKPLFLCENLYFEALSEWLEHGYVDRGLHINETSIVDHFNWKELRAAAAEVKSSVESNRIFAIGKSIQKLFVHLMDGIMDVQQKSTRQP